MADRRNLAQEIRADLRRVTQMFPTNWVTIGLIGAALVIFLITMISFTTLIEGLPTLLAVMFAGCVVLVGLLSLRVFGRLYGVWRDRRTAKAGSRLHLRLVALLSTVAILPTIIAFMFSAFILSTVSDEFFVDRIDYAADTARGVANSYFGSVADKMGNEMARVAVDLTILEQSGRGIEVNPIGFRQYLYGQAILRDWAAIYLVDGNKQIIARVETVPGVDYRLPNAQTFQQVDVATDISGRFNFVPQNPDRLDLYRGTLKIRAYDGGYLIAYLGESPIMTNELLKVREFRDSTASFKSRLSDLREMFGIGYALLALIILLGAVWSGMMAATAIVSPIGRLGTAAEKISQGDLGQQVDIRKSDGELGEFAATFNRMSLQLQTQRDDLIEANRQSDDRRQFTEAVLSGVSAGVLGVSAEGRLTIANRTATELLQVSSGKIKGMQLKDVSPELADLFMAAEEGGEEISRQIEIARGAQTRILNVRIGNTSSGETLTYVITFDDITELISAQRNAAWGDVARRIAHEIKNPLTPIQLSAERLRRKYRDEITSNPDVFERCTETIIRHVGDIGRMVNEFSSFARMPEPVMAKENIKDIVRNAVFPFQVAHGDVDFETSFPKGEITAYCDGRLLVQACTNLVKNAVEAIEERQQKGVDPSHGHIRISVEQEAKLVTISVVDNGVGLPQQVSHRLTEPYMTTRKKGTGLGLAIVRKVIEEHGGTLTFENDTSLGETGARMTMTLPRETGGGGETIDEANGGVGSDPEDTGQIQEQV